MKKITTFIACMLCVFSYTVSHAAFGISLEGENQTTASSTTKNAKTSTSSSTSVSSNTNVSVGLENLDLQVSSDANVSNNASSVQNQADVSSSADLELYARSVMAKNHMITDVKADNEKVAVTYEGKAKLFGFIPVKSHNTATVEFTDTRNGGVEAKVTVTEPWWRFLALAENKVETVQESLQSKLDAQFSAEAGVNARTYAELINTIQTHVMAEASASVK